MSAVVLYASALLGATVFDVTFDRANEAYRAGEHVEAVNLYEQLVADGVVNATVFYNLGNAYFRSGHLAPAIANYERALQIDPNFEYAEQNLRLCIDQTPRGAGRPLPPAWEQSLLFWHYGLSARASTTAGVFCWLLAWAVLGLRLARPLPYTRVVVLVAFALSVLFALSVWSKRHPVPIAVAGAAEVPVYFDRDASGSVHFQLLIGDRVSIEQEDGEWLRIVEPSGERGWAKRDAFAIVGPPYERPPDGFAAAAPLNPDGVTPEPSL